MFCDIQFGIEKKEISDFEAHASFLQIYNEDLLDLLAVNDGKVRLSGSTSYDRGLMMTKCRQASTLCSVGRRLSLRVVRDWHRLSKRVPNNKRPPNDLDDVLLRPNTLRLGTGFP